MKQHNTTLSAEFPSSFSRQRRISKQSVRATKKITTTIPKLPFSSWRVPPTPWTNSARNFAPQSVRNRALIARRIPYHYGRKCNDIYIWKCVTKVHYIYDKGTVPFWGQNFSARRGRRLNGATTQDQALANKKGSIRPTCCSFDCFRKVLFFW